MSIFLAIDAMATIGAGRINERTTQCGEGTARHASAQSKGKKIITPNGVLNQSINASWKRMVNAQQLEIAQTEWNVIEDLVSKERGERKKLSELKATSMTLAVKIFSVLVNCIPDERTGSKFTLLKFPLPRERQEPYRPVARFKDINKDPLLAVSTGTVPRADASGLSATEETESDENEEDPSRQLGERQELRVEDVVLRADKDINLESPLLTNHIATLPVSGSPNTSAPRA
ncbi:hypothetical protein HD554DRAFT_2042257 [Boletus coccyginus]|nr:hypothetical protein HD554DRAFT_2042257 [Boletus coccyginus]